MLLTISVENAGRRLDKFLFSYLNAAPVSFVYKMLRKKRIKLNASRAHGNETLAEGDVLRFYLADDTIKGFRKDVFAREAKPMPEIVFEDENLLIANKPAGLASHGGMEGKSDHLLARLLFYVQEKGEYPPDADFAPGICNRLDINTSGLIVCGKNLKTLQTFNAMFRERKIKKEYLTIVEGIAGYVDETKILENFFAKDENARMAKIKKNPANASANEERGLHGKKGIKAMANNSLEVITKYTVLATSKTHSYLLVEPITGRFHQIRAHLAYAGFPLAGDKKYGGKPTQYARNQLLHCHRLIAHELELNLQAPPPENFARCIKDWFGGIF